MFVAVISEGQQIRFCWRLLVERALQSFQVSVAACILVWNVSRRLAQHLVSFGTNKKV